MRESDLLAHIYQRSRGLRDAYAHVQVGPGDDCAVVATPSGDQILLTVDQLVEGRHFLRGTPVDRIARKIVARSVSDIAAMGGTTRGGWGLATGAIPAGYDKADALFDAMAKWARHWGCPLVGGDIATTAPLEETTGVDARAPMVLTVTIAGLPHPVRGPVLRSTAQVGDDVYVTGAIGGSFASGRHLTFEPRLAEAAWLCDHLGHGGWGLHAMIDVSDGLGRDAGRIAAASGVRIEIEAALIPLWADVGGDWRAATGEGEDYELLFTAAPGVEVPATCPATGTPITRIGRVVEAGAPTPHSTDAPVVVIDGERVYDVSELGWDH